MKSVRLAVRVFLVGSALGGSFAGPAFGQRGVFGTLTAAFASGGNSYASYGTAGAGVGLFDTLLQAGPLNAGIEVRGLAAPSTYELVAGGRVGLRGRHLRPYAVLLGGVKGQRDGLTSTGSAFCWQAGGGLDVSQGRFLDWRAADVTAGALLTLSTGVVVRF